MYAPFSPSPTKDSISFDIPKISAPMRKSICRVSLNNDYVGHVYSFACTIPIDYLYWFSPSPRKTLTVTGESKAQVLKQFRDAVLSSKLALAAQLAIELHCSGYFSQAFMIIVEIIGSHIHIHNPNICSYVVDRYKKFRKQLGLPSRCGTTHFPEQKNEKEFKEFCNKAEIQAYRSTINCQAVRNFVVEMVTLVCLSHQKEMALPRVSNSDINIDKLCVSATSYKVGGRDPMRIARKNELTLALQIIEKLLLYKDPKIEDAIYWILWIVKLDDRCKRKGENLPCKTMKVQNVARSETNHWVWYVWKSLFVRVNFCPLFKKIQITNIYYLFRIDYTKQVTICRLPLLFFAIRLLKYDVGNSFPAVINHLHLHIQACANVNVLYRNLQIRLARKSWVDIIGSSKSDDQHLDSRVKPNKPQKLSRSEEKKRIKELELSNLHNKTAYMDIVPRTNTTQ